MTVLLDGKSRMEESMESRNEPATLLVSGKELAFDAVTEALRYAVEEVEQGDRALTVLITESGQRFHWPEISRMYEEHLQGP
jgi:hypothetical protein